MRAVLYFFLSVLFSGNVFGQNTAQPLRISHLTGDFYVYTTYKIMDGQQIPSNGLYLVTDEGVVVIDTPWDEDQFQPFLDSIEKKHHKKAVMSISTHYHDDRTAGLDYFRTKGIKTYTSKLTYDLCALHKENQSEYYFTKDTLFTIGKHKIATYYPGEGHTKDNIVIWFEKEKILYGGCLVKSTDNHSMGYIADANVPAWKPTIEKVIHKFPKPKYIIPGHYDWLDNRSLQHTLRLLELNEKEQKP